MSHYVIESEMVPTDYSTRLVVTSQWLPILGSGAFSLYQVYVCLLTMKAPPLGSRPLAGHIGFTQTTVLRFNALLTITRLCRFEVPDIGPTRVLLLEPRPVTPETISDLYAAVINHPQMTSAPWKYFRESFEARLDAYISLQDRLSPLSPFPPSSPLPLLELMTNGGTAAPPQPETPTISRLSDRIARAIGIEGHNVRKVAENPPNLVLAWALDGFSQPKLTNVAGYVVKRLQSDATPSPVALELAHDLLSMSRGDFNDLVEMPPDDLPADFYPSLTDSHLSLFDAVHQRWDALPDALFG